MREVDFNRFTRLSNQLVIAAKNFGREENLPSVSKDLDEQFKLAQKVIDVVEPANWKLCVTLLRYNVEESENL